jgi:hypothetical protein
MHEEKISCYLFPIELLSSRSRKLNLNEWKLLNAFYYLKSRAARAGSETVEISLRMLESDFGIQKISGKNLNCSTFIDTIPEKPVDNNRLLFRSSFPEDTRSFLIPDHYIAPPFPWIERWKKKKSRLRRRMSILQSCRLFAAMLASRNSAGSADRVSVIQCQDLFKLSGFSMNMRALCDYLNFLKTEGVLTAFEPKKKQITVHWSLEEYGSLTGFSQNYQLSPPEEYSTCGKHLHKALTRVLNQCSRQTDPEGAFLNFPFSEFLWLLQHLNPDFTRMIKKSSPLIDEYTKGVRQYDKDLIRTFLVDKGIERELADLITIDFDSLSLFKTGGRKTVEKKLSYLLKRCGLNFDVHREVIVAGPYASDARKKSSRKFSFPDATSLFMLPSFEEFAAQKPYRITINVLNRSLSCPTALTGQVIHTSNDSSSFRPALFVPLLQSGEVFFRVECSKEVEHLRLSLWILAPAESLKPSGATDS